MCLVRGVHNRYWSVILARPRCGRVNTRSQQVFAWAPGWRCFPFRKMGRKKRGRKGSESTMGEWQLLSLPGEVWAISCSKTMMWKEQFIHKCKVSGLVRARNPDSGSMTRRCIYIPGTQVGLCKSISRGVLLNSFTAHLLAVLRWFFTYINPCVICFFNETVSYWRPVSCALLAKDF